MNFSKPSLFYTSLISLFLLLCLIFTKSLIPMIGAWETEEYSHGYLIPVISGWLIWENRASLIKLNRNGSWIGFILVLVGLVLGLLGELATIFTLAQYGFLLALFGLCLACFGFQGGRILLFPLAYLFFMIPIPNFLFENLSSYLQLVSSRLGVAVIRFFNISVFLEGNVIDLGGYQLQVVEACSGLRYLFPLSSFGFLCAYFFRAKFWMRLIVFLSTLPITVLMNSFRIGVIGILVDHWGTAQAEGFLHDFEGWVIFIVCLGVLFFEMWLLTKCFLPGKAFSDVFIVGVDKEQEAMSSGEYEVLVEKTAFSRPYILSCGLLLFAIPLSWYVAERGDIRPQRAQFNTFPLEIDAWHGVEEGMQQKYIDRLKFDDYIIANYSRPGDAIPINFYVAYYASQKQGAAAHSPKACIPGDGWQISDFRQKEIADVLTADGQKFRVNSVVISKKDQKQLVYYWFQQRGRVITSEYLMKWYLFWDSLTQQRTDGALVRLALPLKDLEAVAGGDARLAAFIRSVRPLLINYVPN